MKKYSYLKFIIVIFLCIVAIHTRFIGLGWGLPYPMHPDERNMANSIQQLRCDDIYSTECFNPHFFAYGQFPLYLSYIFIKVIHALTGDVTRIITFEEATMALRVISVMSSFITIYVLLQITRMFISPTRTQKDSNEQEESLPSLISDIYTSDHFYLYVVSMLLFIFSPVFIQFAHYGTTESLLMMFYVIVLLLSLQLMSGIISSTSYIRWSGIALGIAIATKVSALPFVAIPGLTLLWYFVTKKDMNVVPKILMLAFSCVRIAAFMLVFFVLLSPYNIMLYQDFLGTIMYESSIGFGEYIPFYTKQFDHTLPFIFQLFHVFPYALGLPVFVSFVISFFLLPWKKEYLLLRFAFVLIFVPNAVVFAKWTRFIAPVYPIMVLMVALLFVELAQRYERQISARKKNSSLRYVQFLIIVIVIIFSLPGIAYLAIYRNADVRFTASQWIFKNIPANSRILSETANVVDIPLSLPTTSINDFMSKNYATTSFNFYDLDENPLLEAELQQAINQADYIFVPSRRIFANHTCMYPSAEGYYENNLIFHSARCDYLESKYPKLHNYYRELFSGEMGFEQVAEIAAYPRISILGKTLIEFPDEKAEETWTVFDHPVIRIYKRKAQ